MWLVLAWVGCNGGPTKGTTSSGLDADGDGATGLVDCNESDPAIHPGAEEHCDGVDENCNDRVDDDPVDGDKGYIDEDGDGYGVELADPCDGTPRVPDGADCDDTDENVFPGAVEQCNGRDDDCDPDTEEGALIGEVLYASVKDAVEAAGDGDVVEVCDGTFDEDSIVVTAEITVTSRSADREAAVIDADKAGSVFVVQSGSLTLRSLTIQNGSAPDIDMDGFSYGGGVDGSGGPVVIEDCAFLDNRTAPGMGYGGAVHGVDVTVVDSAFTDNGATEAGGAIHVDAGGTLSISGSTFELNVAGSAGGAVSVVEPAGEVAIGGSTFDANQAGSHGGAVDGAGLAITDCAFTGNVATDASAYGGAFSSLAHVALTGSTFTENEADLGGAGYVLGGGVDLVGVTFTGNSAVSAGALYLVQGASTADAATSFLDNRATGDLALSFGGAVQLEDGGVETSWSGGMFVGNVADALGGGVFARATGGGPIIVSGVTADGNAAYSGGGVYLWGVPIRLLDSVLTANHGTGGGGGSSVNFTDAGEAVIERVEYRANTASVGAATDIYYGRGVLVDCVVEENIANQGGGVYIDAVSTLAVTTSDFGEGATDNLADDVFNAGTNQGFLYGIDATFACQPGVGCQ